MRISRYTVIRDNGDGSNSLSDIFETQEEAQEYWDSEFEETPEYVNMDGVNTISFDLTEEEMKLAYQ